MQTSHVPIAIILSAFYSLSRDRLEVTYVGLLMTSYQVLFIVKADSFIAHATLLISTFDIQVVVRPVCCEEKKLQVMFLVSI